VSLEITELYKVTKKDVNVCAQSLAEAFSDDNAMSHLTGRSGSREKRLKSLFRFIVRASLKYDNVYATSPRMEGVVVWLPENVTYLSTWEFFTCGGIGIILRHGFKMPWTMMKYEEFTAHRHHEHIKKPHWYLLALAVGKEHRKKGFSSKLMRPFLQYFDDEDIPCYLETGKGNNEAMYRHYGFDLVEKVDLPKNGGVFKAMLRYPQITNKESNV